MIPRYSRVYERSYATLGRRLQNRDRVSEARIRSAAKRLGLAVPRALFDYYRVAGNEDRFNTVYERLLPPEEWFVDQRRLIFMEENQAVVVWGVPATTSQAADPPVYQGVNNQPIKWYKEHGFCSVFLEVTLHWQAAFGGAMPITRTALTSVALRKMLRSTWRFVGEVNRMQAFSKPGKSICHLKWDDGWRVFAGAVNLKKMDEISRDFALMWGGAA